MTLTLTRYIPAGAIKVEDKKSDAVAYLYNGKGDLPSCRVFYGKQRKPVAAYWFRTLAERDACIKRYFEARQARAEMLAKRKAEMMAQVRKVEVGAAFYTSWGYDQTNIDWYEVVALVGKSSARVRRIKSMDASTGNEPWATGKSVPDFGNYCGPEQLVRVRGDGFKVDRHYAHLWDGRPKSWTAYA
jgi:hypothetical protein